MGSIPTRLRRISGVDDWCAITDLPAPSPILAPKQPHEGLRPHDGAIGMLGHAEDSKTRHIGDGLLHALCV